MRVFMMRKDRTTMFLKSPRPLLCHMMNSQYFNMTISDAIRNDVVLMDYEFASTKNSISPANRWKFIQRMSLFSYLLNERFGTFKIILLYVLRNFHKIHESYFCPFNSHILQRKQILLVDLRTHHDQPLIDCFVYPESAKIPPLHSDSMPQR